MSRHHPDRARLRDGFIPNPAVAREALRIAPARPNIAAGIRAGIATTLPLLLVSLLQRPELAFTSLAGFNLVLSDKGGAYRTRARSMLALTLTGTLATFLGMRFGEHPVAAVGLVLLVVAGAGFVRLFGAEATSVGISTAVTLVIAMARTVPDTHEALLCAAMYLAGSLWATLISLVLWPLRVYRPARLALGLALRELARVGLSLVGASADAAAQFARREQIGRARTAIEAARGQLGAIRRGRAGPSRRGELLVALVEASDLLLGALLALEDSLALAQPRGLPELARWIEHVGRTCSSELPSVASALEEERELEPSSSVRVERASFIERATRATTQHEPRIVLRALERLQRVIELARAVDGPAQDWLPTRSEPSDLSSQASKLSLIRDHLTLESAMFRHALRMALATAATVSLMHALGFEHGYWATLTCLVILQPHGAATWAKALQRVLGTAIGAFLAILVASAIYDPALKIPFVFAFVAIAVALLPLNYGAFAVFLTPGFVLLAETHAGDAGLASVRVVNTLIGAAVALLASRLLFPISEREQIRPLLAKALATLVHLLDVAAESPPAIERVRAARRELGLALLNAEASYQRLLTETGIHPEESEALLTLLLYSHRIGSGLIALAFGEGTAAHRQLSHDLPELRRALLDLSQALDEGRTPAPLPEHEVHLESAERVDALFEQLAVLHAARLRLSDPAPSAP
jgi:uncharacterized membrane protein YccC